jgi:interleukin-1 receptor-associated kinase 1
MTFSWNLAANHAWEPSFLELDDVDASPDSVDVSTPSSAGRKSRFMLRDYLKEEQDGS